MLKCCKCTLEKDELAFYKRSSKMLGSNMCKQCFNRYCTDRWIKIKIKAIAYKGSKCVDCECLYPLEPYCIFDFHHLDPKEKEFGWKKLKIRPWKVITKELDKCVLLCSNCHRKRHADE